MCVCVCQCVCVHVCVVVSCFVSVGVVWLKMLSCRLRVVCVQWHHALVLPDGVCLLRCQALSVTVTLCVWLGGGSVGVGVKGIMLWFLQLLPSLC